MRLKGVLNLGLGVVVCVAIVAIGAAVAAVGTKIRAAQAEKRKEAGKAEAALPRVKVRVMKPVLVEDRLELTGSVEPWEDLKISAELPGRIEWQGRDEGEPVKAGEELFRIDTRTIQTQLDQAQAQLTLAEQEFTRAKGLLDKGAAARRDYDAALSGRDVAQAAVRTARVALDKSTVKAPIDGVVDSVFRKQDEFIDMGAPLVRIVQVNRVKLVVGIPERDIPHFAVGDTVVVRADALHDRTFEGRIYRIATTAEQATHTFAAEIELANADGALKPGMIARATLVRERFPDSFLAPIFATLPLDDQRFVFVEKDGVADLRAIEIGVLQGSNVQIKSGVNAGDRLVVTGQRDVRPGEKVDVAEVEE